MINFNGLLNRAKHHVTLNSQFSENFHKLSQNNPMKRLNEYSGYIKEENRGILNVDSGTHQSQLIISPHLLRGKNMTTGMQRAVEGHLVSHL